MTTPLPDNCYDPNRFDAIDGALAPLPWLQWRHVASNTAGSVDGTSPIAAAAAPENRTVVDFDVSWTNDSPVWQRAYTMLTRGGSLIAITARNRACLYRYEGTISGTNVGDPTMALTGKQSLGGDHGLESFSTPRFLVLEAREGVRTTMSGPSVVLQPGQTIRTRMQLVYVVESQETTNPVGGTSEAEMRFQTGESQLDVFAMPSL